MSRIGHARLALLQQKLVDGLDGADVEAARGLDRHHQAGLGADLAGQDEPLQVAAREQPGLGVDRGCRDLVGVLQLLRSHPGDAAVDGPAVPDGLRRGRTS